MSIKHLPIVVVIFIVIASEFGRKKHQGVYLKEEGEGVVIGSVFVIPCCIRWS